MGGVRSKIIFDFFADSVFCFQYAFVVAPFQLGELSDTHAAENNLVEDFPLICGQRFPEGYDPTLSSGFLNVVVRVLHASETLLTSRIKWTLIRQSRFSRSI